MRIHPNTNWRILGVMSLVLAMSGLLVQAAHAMPADQGPFGTPAAGSVPVDSRPLTVPLHAAQPVPVDSRYMSTPIRPTQVSVPVDSRHIALPIHGTQVSTPVDSRPIVTNTPVVDATPLPQTASDGFNWGDASLGALSAFAAMLLAVSLMLVLRNNRSRLVGLHG
jgi:hypothetical protein